MAGKNGKKADLDFSEFWREWEQNNPDEAGVPVEPKRITVVGRTYDLPASLPAITVLRTLRNDNRGTLDMLRSGADLFGMGELERWAEAGMGVDAICAAISAAESLIRGVPGERLLEIARGEGQEEGEKKSLTS